MFNKIDWKKELRFNDGYLVSPETFAKEITSVDCFGNKIYEGVKIIKRQNNMTKTFEIPYVHKSLTSQIEQFEVLEALVAFNLFDRLNEKVNQDQRVINKKIELRQYITTAKTEKGGVASIIGESRLLKEIDLAVKNAKRKKLHADFTK